MKLQGRHFESDEAGVCTLIPEESEDLWHLYNLVAKGDTVRAQTYRKVQKEFGSGSVATDVRRIHLTITVKQVEYDAAGDEIRFSGKNCEENQYVKLGAHHTISIGLNQKLTVGKEKWDFVFRDLLDEACNAKRSAEIAVVLMDAGIANFYLLTSVLAKEVARVSVNVPKKRTIGSGYDKSLNRFFEQVYAGILQHINFDIVKCVVLAGPGFVKDSFAVHLQESAVRKGDMVLVQNRQAFVVAHASGCYKVALRELLADGAVKSQIASTKALDHMQTLESFYTMLKEDPDRACYGPAQVQKAVEMGAVDSLMVTDGLFRSCSLVVRRKYVELVEGVRDAGAKVLVFSEQHVSGEQLKQLSGIAALLRFPCVEIDDIDSDAELDFEGVDVPGDADVVSDDGGDGEDPFT
mmetsp:Transcript_36633/g.79993  ORF Transcript_36633/g.79993 Transcript_36633/m.79993 type:complete len:408 (-) Transcript_36633:79-1302(-)